MTAYGKIALLATEQLQSGRCSSPIQAWDHAASEVFPDSKASREKNCPRSTFLGLCEEGCVTGVTRGSYTQSAENKRYAIRAVQLLRTDPDLGDHGPESLWKRVMEGEFKQPNSQMDVVLALWHRGFLGGRGKMVAFWGIIESGGKFVEEFPYSRKVEAEEKVRKLEAENSKSYRLEIVKRLQE